MKIMLCLPTAILLPVLCLSARADVVTEWNEQLEHAIKTQVLSPAIQGRYAAVVHVAIYDAVNGLALKYEPYFVKEAAPVGGRQDAAAIQAAYSTLKWLFPTQSMTFDAALATSLSNLADSQTQSNAIAQGRAWGESVANRIIAWRAQDGLTNATPDYFGGTNIGQWRSIPTPTAPDGTLPSIFPQLATLVPFAMTQHDQFRPGPPYGLPLDQALASPQYAADLNEVKAIGRVDSATRTAEQTSIARLWQATGAAEENKCLRQVIPSSNSLVDNARIFALANIVGADTTIVGFDSKLTYGFWRPHHAIRFADQDGNSETSADPEWSALITAPRHPEYISNHAVITGGFMYLLAQLLGDEQTFTLSSVDLPGFSWTFHHFSEAIVQVKNARIWAGIHYRNSCDVGQAIGQRVADYVLGKVMRPRHTDVVLEWNQHLERAIKTAAQNPALQGRSAAIMHVAIYDAVNGIVGKYQPYFVKDVAPVGAREDAAAVQAAYTTLSWLYPTQAMTFDAALASSLAKLPEAQSQSGAITQGRAWGETVAQRIIAWRAQDGFTNPAPNYFGGTNIGQWRSVPTPTAPDGTLPAVFPQLASLVPFAMTNHDQFRPGPPYGLPLDQALASPQYAADFNEVKSIGRLDSTLRTPDQTSIGLLWQAISVAEENNGVRQVVPDHYTLVDSARLFALINMVAADALIAGFDCKYTYNFWRPHHAIRFADQDGNPETAADTEWSALFVAPRHQEYFSNHSVFTGGFMYLLGQILGEEHTFTLSSLDYPGFAQTFHHFHAAAIQAMNARVWAGIHFRNSCNVGQVIGQQVAGYVLNNFLRPMIPLVITQQPQDQIATVGSTIGLTVAATGSGPLTYQWRGLSSTSITNIPGGTNATLTFENAPLNLNGRRFDVVVADGSGLSTNSASVTLRVGDAPSLTSQPGELVSAVLGESIGLRVIVRGTSPYSYSWTKDGEVLTNRAGISGAKTTRLVLTSFQTSGVGNYQVIVTNLFGSTTSRVVHLTAVAPTTFSHVTNGPVATAPGQSTGAVWADFDNDGDLDLYVGYYAGTNRFYLNNGDGSFTRVTQGDFLNTGTGTLGVSAADYDNDGNIDLSVAAGGAEDTPQSSSLFRNNGNGNFTRVTAGGIGGSVGNFFAVDWSDYDSDGFLDAIITSPSGRDANGNALGGINQLWHNSGNGSFTRITNAPVATDQGTAWGALWFDYDGDGRPDLLTLNINYESGGRNYLYHNEGDGNFTRNLTSPIAKDVLSGGSEGADWGDYDNDGLLDLFVADSGGSRSFLYHNLGGGSFSNIMGVEILIPPSNSQPHGASWGDYDNDGYLDLVVVHAYQNVLYRNNQDGTFSTLLQAGFADDRVSDPYFFNNVTWVDYDNDGFLDLHFCLAGGENDRPNYLYHNAGNSNGWVEIKCVGTVANRSAIGTRVRAQATIGGKTFWQTRELKSSAGWDVGSPLVAHFGLGDALKIEVLRLEWPSGTVQELRDVMPRQILTVVEPPRLVATKVGGQPQFTLEGGRNMTYAIENSADLLTWSAITTVTITEMSGTASIVDPTPNSGHTFYRAVQK